MKSTLSISTWRALSCAGLLVLSAPQVVAQVWEADPLAQFFSLKPNDSTGFVVENAGDIDGDGRNDALIGAPNKPFGAQLNCGFARIISSDGSILHTFIGSAGDYLGHSVAGAGDVDGDGVADVIVGAPQFNSGAGRACLYSGLGHLIIAIDGEVIGDEFGFVVAAAGDVNGDGFDDVIVGAPKSDQFQNNSGTAYVYSGANGNLLYRYMGIGTGDQLGGSVGPAGDRNADGYDDFIIAAPHGGPFSRGQANVYSGLDGSLMCLLNSPAGGVEFGNYFCGLAGDVNADGVPDTYVIDYARDGGRGRLFVYSGADCTTLHSITGPLGSKYLFGRVRVGDLDGDGHDDMVLSSGQYDGPGNNSGALYIYSGASGELIGHFQGDEPGMRLGTDCTGVGDVTGDGVPDMVVGVGNYYQGRGGLFFLSGAPFPPSSYCHGAINSTGGPASLDYTGSLSLSDAEFTVTCDGLSNSMGVLFGGNLEVNLPFGSGVRCAGGSLQRYGIQHPNASGHVEQIFDSSSGIPVGSTWHMQYWYRDPAGGGPGFTTSDALRFTLRP